MSQAKKTENSCSRDNETEGTFGDFKENMGYDKLYKREHDNVQMKIQLVTMGHNNKNTGN